MNVRVALISSREKAEQLLEGLICLATSAVVFSGTLAICFPAIA
jgi:hypothetical protein